MIARFARDNEPVGRTNEAAIGLQSFVIRTAGDPRRFVPLVRDAVQKLDPAIGVDSIEPADRLLAAVGGAAAFLRHAVDRLRGRRRHCWPRSASTACSPTRW